MERVAACNGMLVNLVRDLRDLARNQHLAVVLIALQDFVTIAAASAAGLYRAASVVFRKPPQVMT